jgi:hypothetical protein
MDGFIKSSLQRLQKTERVMMNDGQLARRRAETPSVHKFHARQCLQNSYLSANCMTRGCVSRPV